MVEIFGKNYSIDIDEIIRVCETSKKSEPDSDPESEASEINIFKYEILKFCLDRILNDIDDNIDEKIPFYAQSELSISFKIAFNTLIKYNILTEDVYE